MSAFGVYGGGWGDGSGETLGETLVNARGVVYGGVSGYNLVDASALDGVYGGVYGGALASSHVDTLFLACAHVYASCSAYLSPRL